MLVVEGSLGLAVSDSALLLQALEEDPAVSDALAATMAGALPGVDADMVEILSASASRRLSTLSLLERMRRLAPALAQVHIDYRIVVPVETTVAGTPLSAISPFNIDDLTQDLGDLGPAFTAALANTTAMGLSIDSVSVAEPVVRLVVPTTTGTSSTSKAMPPQLAQESAEFTAATSIIIASAVGGGFILLVIVALVFRVLLRRRRSQKEAALKAAAESGSKMPKLVYGDVLYRGTNGERPRPPKAFAVAPPPQSPASGAGPLPPAIASPPAVPQRAPQQRAMPQRVAFGTPKAQTFPRKAPPPPPRPPPPKAGGRVVTAALLQPPARIEIRC